MTALTFLADLTTALLFLLGATLTLLAAVGLLRLPDTFLRMQASSKASTLGLACLLAGAGLQFHDVSTIIRLASIAAFIMLTAPLSAHIVARASLHRGTPLWSGSVLDEYDRAACAAPSDPVPSERALAEPTAPDPGEPRAPGGPSSWPV